MWKPLGTSAAQFRRRAPARSYAEHGDGDGQQRRLEAYIANGPYEMSARESTPGDISLRAQAEGPAKAQDRVFLNCSRRAMSPPEQLIEAISFSDTQITRFRFLFIEPLPMVVVIGTRRTGGSPAFKEFMKVWSRPAVREQEVGLEVTSYMPAEIDII